MFKEKFEGLKEKILALGTSLDEVLRDTINNIKNGNTHPQNPNNTQMNTEINKK